MGGNVSKEIMSEVLQVIPAASPGLSYDEIHGYLGMWSPITIRHAVRQLKEEGLIEREGNAVSARFYRAATL